MDKVIPVKFIVEVLLVTLFVVPAKAKHDRGMDGRTDDGRNDPYLSDTQ